MSNWRRGLLSIIVLGLVGCASEPYIPPPKIIEVSKPIIALPKPVESCSVHNLSIQVVDGKAYIAIPYSEYIDYSKCTRDYVRYLKDINNTLCYYTNNKGENCK